MDACGDGDTARQLDGRTGRWRGAPCELAVWPHRASLCGLASSSQSADRARCEAAMVRRRARVHARVPRRGVSVCACVCVCLCVCACVCTRVRVRMGTCARMRVCLWACARGGVRVARRGSGTWCAAVRDVVRGAHHASAAAGRALLWRSGGSAKWRERLWRTVTCVWTVHCNLYARVACVDIRCGIASGARIQRISSTGEQLGFCLQDQG